jgi:vitamin B12 transporter
MYKSLTAALVLLPGLAQASNEIPRIVITATGYPISAREALVPVEVFDAEDISRSSARDLGEVLSLANGLEVARNGGPGQPASLFTRGTESDHTLVLVDGVPVNSATVASAAVQHIDSQLLQRVEVVKGPQSTLWGSGAMGGVISVDTITPFASGTRAGVSLEAGERATRRVSARWSHGSDNASLGLGVARYETDGLPTLDISDIASPHENTSLALSGGLRGEGVEVEASHWQARGETGYLAFTYPAPSFDLVLQPVSQDFLNSVSQLTLAWSPAENVDSRLQFSLARDHIDQNDSIDFAHTDRRTLTWRNIVRLANGDRLNAGAELGWEEAAIESFGSAYTGTTDQQAVYFQYDGRRGPHQLLAGMRLLEHEDAGSHATWNLGYGYRLSADTLLKANASTGFRYPTAVERFVFSPNPDLRPERSRALELGVSHAFDPGQELDISLFATRIDDLIVSTGVFPNTINVNVDRAEIGGAEAAYRLRRGPWQLHASVLAQDPVDRSDDSRLLRRARFTAKLRIDYLAGQNSAGIEVSHSGARRDIDGVDFTPATTDAYTVVNLNANRRLDRNWTLFGRVENLFDTDYELASRYRTPGRTLAAGIRFDLE